MSGQAPNTLSFPAGIDMDKPMDANTMNMMMNMMSNMQNMNNQSFGGGQNTQQNQNPSGGNQFNNNNKGLFD